MQKEIFQPSEYLDSRWYFFKDSELGRMHASIPWEQLSECLPAENKGAGASRWFNNKSLFGLMFLKSYLNLSDEKLIDRFNCDWSMQMFCGMLLAKDEQIRDKSIMSRVRSCLAEKVDWQQVQSVLINHWKSDINNQHVLLMDATCYESYIRFPTDVKLLWESCEWIFEKQLFKICKFLSIKRPRSKYQQQRQKYLSYERKKKKTYKEGERRKKSLIYLLDKGIKQLQEVLNKYREVELDAAQYQYLKTIKMVLEQQTFLQSHPAKELKNRIVSLPKPYVRPIIRGKENKRVEFGMKVHMMQVDGICLFDTMSFNAFNETTRLKISVLKHQSWFGKCHQLAADNIYPTNSNRTFLTEKKIFTNFPRKGSKKYTPQEQVLRSQLSKQRATVMEGSFGNHKTSYGLQKVKAKKESTEIIWVFFAVMTANVVRISKRNERQHCPAAA